jgi:hypothetical protein
MNIFRMLSPAWRQYAADLKVMDGRLATLDPGTPEYDELWRDRMGFAANRYPGAPEPGLTEPEPAAPPDGTPACACVSPECPDPVHQSPEPEGLQDLDDPGDWDRWERDREYLADPTQPEYYAAYERQIGEPAPDWPSLTGPHPLPEFEDRGAPVKPDPEAGS